MTILNMCHMPKPATLSWAMEKRWGLRSYDHKQALSIKERDEWSGFWLRIDHTHVAILALVWIQTRELLCTQSIRKYNWKIEPWYSRMDRLEFSSLRVVFLWGGTHIFLSRFYENRVERHHLSLSFVRILTRRRGMRQRHHSHLFNFGLSRVWS